MKIGLLGSKVENINNDTNVLIENILNEKGISVDKSFFKDTLEQEYKDPEGTYARNQKILKDNDAFIVDITKFSSGIGYLIGSMLGLKKPVLVHFNKLKGKLVSSTLKSTSLKSKLLSYKEYSDTQELEKIINDYLTNVKQNLDTKFILIIPSEIDRYLEWCTSEKRMHKAQIVREAIEDMMNNDKEWKKNNQT